MTDGTGHSPCATGGGGITFERRVAVLYLTRLLTGSAAAELHGRRVTRVSFQCLFRVSCGLTVNA